MQFRIAFHSNEMLPWQVATAPAVFSLITGLFFYIIQNPSLNSKNPIFLKWIYYNWIYYLVDPIAFGCMFSLILWTSVLFFELFSSSIFLNFKIYLYCSHTALYKIMLESLKLFSYSFFSCFIALFFSSFLQRILLQPRDVGRPSCT